MLTFDDFELDPANGLSREGVPVPLEPQALQLLAFLVEHRDRLVTKQEIIDEIWGGNAITDAALNTRIRSVRKALGDTAATSAFIKTFPKRGFQFVASVTDAGGQAAGETRSSKTRNWLLGVCVALVLTIGLVFGLTDRDTDRAREKPSLAVAQFDNLGGDPSTQYFVDGLSDDLIARLSRNRELFVISRATMVSYANAQATPVETARDLGVRYVVRGSVQRANDEVRVSGELIDVDANETVWAEVFEQELTDIFDVQDNISQAIAGQLLPEIYQSDAARLRAKPTESMGAWDFYLRGRARQAEFSKESQQDAIDFAEKAIALDQGFAAAHSLKARALGTIFFFQWTDNPQDTLISATEAAKRAIQLDDQDAQAHAALGYIYRFTGKSDLALSNLNRAVELNPNDARIRLELAHTYDWFRMQDQALPQINMALKLSPRDPMLQNMFFYKGHILFHLGRHEDALDAAQHLGAVATSNTWRVFFNLLRAANLSELDRADDAQDAIDAALAINPKLSISAMQRQFAGSKNHEENRRAWLASLKKAGLPD